MQISPWTVVLAAGAGTRLASLTGGVPKQFWRRDGTPTLLENTLARLRPLSSDSRTVIVADASHRAHFAADWWTAGRADVLFQPLNRGTAAGVLFALTSIIDRHPEAVVVFTPADHGVADVGVFHSGLKTALTHASRTEDVVLCAVEADQPIEDYGWVVPSSGPDTRGVARVRRFVEKPARLVAEALMREGGAWSTMVVVARARILAALFDAHLPAVARVFVEVRETHPGSWRDHLAPAYESLASYDFSRDLIERAANLATYVWPASVGWSDLGTPDRLMAWSQNAAARCRTAVAAA